MTVTYRSLTIEWLGYATVRIETVEGYVVYFDPGRYGVLGDYYARDGDLICVTHDHHYDSDGIRHVATEDATVVAFGGIDAGGIDRDVEPLEALPFEVVTVGQEDRYAAAGAHVWSVPAYNDPGGPHVRADGTPYHPEGSGVGYLLSLDGQTVFWPGDSDALSGYEQLSVSVLLANIGGTVATDRHEAADLADALGPELVVPVHYDTLEMLEADSAGFAADVARRSIPVALDEHDLQQ
jgi:L-ascorbate metabolism protein UlaG (beta-lactamase superfamily)